MLSAAHAGLAGSVHTHARTPAVVTQGSIFGSFQIQVTTTGPVLSIGGTGTVRPLGNVTANGNIHIPSVTPGQTVQGTVTLAGGNGGAILSLTGQIPRKVSASSTSINVRNIRVTVLGGTGSFSTLHGTGTGTLSLKLQAPALTSGTFSFSFHTVGH